MALVVGEKFQSQGVGSALLESLESWFRENGCKRVEVNSGDHREVAHEFYQSNGYRVDERRFIKSNAP
jgi:GNAT superfamily N-acetyltransferase